MKSYSNLFNWSWRTGGKSINSTPFFASWYPKQQLNIIFNMMNSFFFLFFLYEIVSNHNSQPEKGKKQQIGGSCWLKEVLSDIFILKMLMLYPLWYSLLLSFMSSSIFKFNTLEGHFMNLLVFCIMARTNLSPSPQNTILSMMLDASTNKTRQTRCFP